MLTLLAQVYMMNIEDKCKQFLWSATEEEMAVCLSMAVPLKMIISIYSYTVMISSEILNPEFSFTVIDKGVSMVTAWCLRMALKQDGITDYITAHDVRKLLLWS